MYQEAAALQAVLAGRHWDCFPDQDCFPKQDAHVMEAAEVDPPEYRHCKSFAITQGFGAFTVGRSGRAFFRGQPSTACRSNMVSAATGVKLFIMNETDTNATPVASGPLQGRCAFSCGLIADVQYADVDDCRGRHYRATTSVLEQAVEFFNGYDLAFVAHLGDIVDYRNQRKDADGTASRAALHEVLARFGRLRILQDERGEVSQTALEQQRLVCILGNHELYNFPRRSAELTQPPFARDGRNFYTFSPASGWRVVVLDPYDFSVMSEGRSLGGRGGHHTNSDALRYAQAQYSRIAEEAHNLGESIPADAARFKSSTGAFDFNGKLGETQLRWLSDTLTAATSANERVIILCHVFINPPHHRPNCFQNLMWNYSEVVDLLHSPAGCCVVACLHGHAHTGDRVMDEAGIHYLALDTPMHAEVGTDGRYHGPWAVLEAHADCLVLRGNGNEGSSLFDGGSCDAAGCRVVTLPLRPL